MFNSKRVALKLICIKRNALFDQHKNIIQLVVKNTWKLQAWKQTAYIPQRSIVNNNFLFYIRICTAEGLISFLIKIHFVAKIFLLRLS